MKNSRKEVIEVYLCRDSLDDEKDSNTIFTQNYDTNSSVNMRTPKKMNNFQQSTNDNSDNDLNNLLPVDSDQFEMQNSESGYHSYFGSSSMIYNANGNMNSNSNNNNHNKMNLFNESNNYQPTPIKSDSFSASPMSMEKSLLSSPSVYDENENQVITKSLFPILIFINHFCLISMFFLFI